MFANIYYLLFETPHAENAIYWFFTYIFIVSSISTFMVRYSFLNDIHYNPDYDRDIDPSTDEDSCNDDSDTDCDKNKNVPIIKPPPKPPVKINYEDKYLEKFKKIENKYLNVEKLVSLKNSFVFESTPVGRVIMSYNYDTDPDLCHFYYYSNTIIPYKILDIVAQKYVITFDCKTLYIDVATELDNLKKKVIENHKKINDELASMNKDNVKEPLQNNKLFATFKKYNTTSTNIQIKDDNSKLVIKEKINKYINKGKITNFEFIKKIDKKLLSKNYSLKFSDFKKLNL